MDISLEILNGCISLIIGLISTKLEGFVELGKIYLTISTLSSSLLIIPLHLRIRNKQLSVCN